MAALLPQRTGAASGGALDQTFLRQLLQGPPDGDAGHAKLLHQLHFARQTSVKTPFAQLLAQHQIDLVVFGQGHDIAHALHTQAALLSCQ